MLLYLVIFFIFCFIIIVILFVEMCIHFDRKKMRVAPIDDHWWYDRRLSIYDPKLVGNTMSTRLTEPLSSGVYSLYLVSNLLYAFEIR